MTSPSWFASLPTPKASPACVTSQTIRQWMSEGSKDFLIVDTRRADIDDLPVMLPGAINLPAQTFYQTLPATFPLLSRYSKVVFHCSSSKGRGPRCAGWYQDHLDSVGNVDSEALVLTGGIKDWMEQYPSEILNSNWTLALLPPYEEAKILLPISADLENGSITDLKKYLFKSISTVRLYAEKSKDLVLEIEGFELLSGSQIREAIQEGDVVTIRLAAGSSQSIAAKKPAEPNEEGKISYKRKSAPVSNASRKKRKHSTASSRVATRDGSAGISTEAQGPVLVTHDVSGSREAESCVRAASVESSVISTSSSSSVSSTVDSSSDSSSMSSDSSSSSSSEGSTSEIQTRRTSRKPNLTSSGTKTNSFPILLQPKQPLQPPIIPGKGNSQTRSRNLRRRHAIKMRRLAHAPVAAVKSPEPANHANGDTYVTTAPSVDPPQLLNENMDISNRNKKKGFLKDMRGVTGVKTVFEHRVEASAAESPIETKSNGQSASAEVPPRINQQAGRVVVPPSEQQSLPSNVFVTSVEFPWARHSKEPKMLETQVEEESEEEMGDALVEPDVETEIDWDGLDKRFDDLSPLTQDQVYSLRAGTAIAWKDLELDKWTFTPVLNLKIGRVVTINHGLIKLDTLRRVEYEWAEEEEEDGLVKEAIEVTEIIEHPGRFRIVS